MSMGMRISRYRKEHGLTQESLARMLNVTNQAVSKWETDQCFPDTMLLPALADALGISLDALFGREEKRESGEEQQTAAKLPWEDDDAFHVVLYCGHTLIGENPSEERVTFCYEGPAKDLYCQLNLECGDVSGDVKAGGYVECGGVTGSVKAGGYVECGDVGGDVASGGYVECGCVGEGVKAVGYVECASVDGDVTAGDYVECSDVGGNVNSGGYVECGDVGGAVRAMSYVECGDVDGNVVAGTQAEFGRVGESRKDPSQTKVSIDMNASEFASMGKDIEKMVKDALSAFRFGKKQEDGQ